MNVKDIKPGYVFQANYELGGTIGGTSDLYVILDHQIVEKHIEVRWLYLSGNDAGSTFRTLLLPNSDWGDWRIM